MFKFHSSKCRLWSWRQSHRFIVVKSNPVSLSKITYVNLLISLRSPTVAVWRMLGIRDVSVRSSEGSSPRILWTQNTNILILVNMFFICMFHHSNGVVYLSKISFVWNLANWVSCVQRSATHWIRSVNRKQCISIRNLKLDWIDFFFKKSGVLVFFFKYSFFFLSF